MRPDSVGTHFALVRRATNCPRAGHDSFALHASGRCFAPAPVEGNEGHAAALLRDVLVARPNVRQGLPNAPLGVRLGDHALGAGAILRDPLRNAVMNRTATPSPLRLRATSMPVGPSV